MKIESIMPIFLHVILISISINSRLIVDYKPLVKNVLTNVTNVKSPSYTCNIIVPRKWKSCLEYAGVFKSSKCPMAVFNLENLDFFLDDYTNLNVFFIERTEALSDALQKLTSSEKFQNRGKYKFVLCQSIMDAEALHRVVLLIWKQKILNFSLIYLNQSINVAIFDPFRDNIFIYQIEQHFEEFPDKLKDVNGYSITLSITFNATKVDPRYNFDPNFLFAFKKATNANVIFNPQPVRNMFSQIVFAKIATSETEFCCITIPCSFLDIPGNISNKVTCSYPHMINDIKALVPKPKIIPANVIRAFANIRIIVSYIALTSLVSLLDLGSSLEIKKLIVTTGLLAAAGIGVPISSMQRGKSVLRHFWIFSSIFFYTIIEIVILHVVFVPRYQTPLKTIGDLNNSNFPIYTYGYMHPQLNTIPLPLDQVKDKLMENEGEAVFIGSYKSLDMYQKVYLNKKHDFKYTMMEESLLKKYGCYVIKKRSIFHQKVKEVIFKVLQMGVRATVPGNNEKLYVDENVLTFQHISAMLYFYLYGLCVATLGFCVEIICPRLVILFGW